MASRSGPSKSLATANRPLAKPSRTRYFKGKAPEAAPSDSDEDESGDDDEDENERRQKARAKKAAAAAEAARKNAALVAGGAGRIIRPGDLAKGQVKMQLGDVKVGGEVEQPIEREEDEESSGEEETDDEEEEEEEAPGRGVKPPGYVPKPPGGESSSEYETDSEEESEEEKKPAFRPVFVRKDQRGMTQEQMAKAAEEKAAKEEELEAQRKLDSKELAGETIRRELAEREVTDLIPDVDDTDDLDPLAEFDAWRARELARLLRDKQAQAARDEEREEIERRLAMPEEQRLREDMEYADQTRAREKTQMGFLQKYYHKGAFHQDDEILHRDYTGATEGQVDMSMLPKVMQVRDFGKMSRTKYTHLTDQDTTGGGWGTAARPGGGPGNIGTTDTGCWNCGGPHMRKDCPNANINDPLVAAGVGGYGGAPGGSGSGGASGGGYGGGGTSANSAPLGYGGSSRSDRYGDRSGGDRPERSYGNGGGDRERGGYSQRREDDAYESRRGGNSRREHDDDRGGRYRDDDHRDRRSGESRDRRYDDEDRYRRDSDRKGGDRGRDGERDRERERDRDRERTRDSDRRR